jgi:hypothetical protein
MIADKLKEFDCGFLSSDSMKICRFFTGVSEKHITPIFRVGIIFQRMRQYVMRNYEQIERLK